MNKDNLVTAVESLNFDEEDYIIVGSGILGMLELREIEDIDIVVSQDIFDNIQALNKWGVKKFADGSHYLTKDIFEIGLDWDSKDCKPNLTELKKDQILIQGIPFINLLRLKSWKLIKGRDKDLIDIKLIDDYLKNKL